MNTSPLWASCSSIVKQRAGPGKGGTPAVDTTAGSLVESGDMGAPLRRFEWASSGLWSGVLPEAYIVHYNCIYSDNIFFQGHKKLPKGKQL